MPRIVIALLMFAALGACKKKPADPVTEVEQAIAKMEKAVEDSDLGMIKSLMTDDYKDGRGQNKSSTISMLQLQFLKRKSIHVLVSIDDIIIDDPKRARTEISVAAAGTPIKDVSMLEGLRAQLLHLDITWAKDGDEWQVKSADWRKASLTDFLK